jgi:phosphoesterase RecJ-like protein
MSARATDRVIRLIRSSEHLYLGTHIRPDGDALGSLLGLMLALEDQGKRVAALCADPVPDNYRFLPGAHRISSQPPAWPAQLGIVLDCDGLSRLGPLEPAFAALPHLVDIDHHHTDHAFGEDRLVDSRAGATAEIVSRLLKGMAIQLTPPVASCLYAALLTDTGRFCFGNTTAHSLHIAAEMVEAGADPHQIARRVYEERSMEATHLLGLALSRLSSDLDGQVVSVMLTREDFARTGAAPGDTEGIIDHLRAIGGPRVALLLVEPQNSSVRVSLRSDGTVDVSEIALCFGGGGHMMAAGCTVTGAAEQVRRRVLEVIGQAFARAGAQDA